MKKFIFLIFLMIFLFLNILFSYAWWDENFLYRRQISINNTANPNNLTDYQVAINVSYYGEMQSDFDDLRFTWYNESNNSEIKIPYWIESKSDGNWAYVWVKVPFIPANGYSKVYMYYGNSTVGSESNGSAVFEFFDDFEGTSLDTSKWVVYANSYSVSNSILRINRGGIERTNAFSFNIQDGYMAETKVKHEVSDAGYGGVLPEVASSPYTAPGNGNADATILYMRGDGSNTVYYWIGDGSTTSYNVGSGSTGWTSLSGVWYITGISVNGGTVKLWRDGVAIVTKTGISWAKNIKYVKLGSFYRDAAYDIQDTSYDWIRVRKYTEPEPTISIGIEQEQFSPDLQFMPPTPANGTIQRNKWIEINISINESNLHTFIFNWNGQNQTYNKSQLNGTAPNYWFYINITNLSDGTYTYYAWANDTAGNSNKTETRIITLDTTPPNITNITITTTTNNALIEWKTNELANASIAYGTNLSLINNKSNSSFVLNHSILLDGLNQNTLYYFNITSCDIVGNCKTEGIYNFTTKKVSEKHGGGRGGGSGKYRGGSKSQEIEENKIKIINITGILNKYNSTTLEISENMQIIFEINGEEHKIIINDFNLTHINITIFSNLINMLLANRTSYYIDLNFDGKPDIKLNYDYPNLMIEKLLIKTEEKIREETFNMPLLNQTKESKEAGRDNLSKFIILITLLILFVLILVIILYIASLLKPHNALQKKINEIEEELRKEGYEWKIKGIIKEE